MRKAADLALLWRHILVKAEPGADLKALKADIQRRLPHNDVYTREEWAKRSDNYGSLRASDLSTAAGESGSQAWLRLLWLFLLLPAPVLRPTGCSSVAKIAGIAVAKRLDESRGRRSPGFPDASSAWPRRFATTA